MSRRVHVCVSCGAKVPPLDDESALISMKYGWRLTRRVERDGTATLEWRCPKCWVEFRDKKPAVGDKSE